MIGDITTVFFEKANFPSMSKIVISVSFSLIPSTNNVSFTGIEINVKK